MRTFPATAFAGVICSVCLSLPALAQSMRCKNDLANIDDSKASILLKCGEPIVKDTFCKPVAQQVAPNTVPRGTTVNVVPCQSVDEWTYKPGYGQFVTTLRFEDGTLKAIKYGDRIN